MGDSLTVGLRARDLDGRAHLRESGLLPNGRHPEEELIGATPPMPSGPPDEFEQPRWQRTSAPWPARRPSDRLRDALSAPQRRAVRRHDPRDAADRRRGRRTGWMGSMVDLTERKRVDGARRATPPEAQQTARLIAMGEMGASTLAHELNQPLTAISATAPAACAPSTGTCRRAARWTDALSKLHAYRLCAPDRSSARSTTSSANASRCSRRCEIDGLHSRHRRFLRRRG